MHILKFQRLPLRRAGRGLISSFSARVRTLTGLLNYTVEFEQDLYSVLVLFFLHTYIDYSVVTSLYKAILTSLNFMVFFFLLSLILVIEIDYIKLNSKNRSTVNEEEKFLCVWIVVHQKIHKKSSAFPFTSKSSRFTFPVLNQETRE